MPASSAKACSRWAGRSLVAKCPYIWLKTPQNLSSWEFFDLLLNKAGVVGTPGSGFGPAGEGYFRLTAFGSTENTAAAIERIRTLF